MAKKEGSIYGILVSAFKKFDTVTGAVVGDIIRDITNVNTRKFWDKKLASYGAKWRSFPYEYFIKFLPRDEAFTLLDIGCAMGDGCIFLKSKFPLADISGADLSGVGIKKALGRTDKIDFFMLDITKEDPPKKYDFISMLHTLEHFNDPYPVVDKCLRFVRRAFMIQVPYTEKFDSPRLYWRGQHRYLFNENTFKGYKSRVLMITDHIKSANYKYIIYELRP